MTEADRVVSTEHRDDGIYWMKRTTHREGKNFNWERVAKLDKDGILHVRGINLITTEWDDPLDSYYDSEYDHQGDAFFLTEAPQDAEHVVNAKVGLAKRLETRQMYIDMPQIEAQKIAEDEANVAARKAEFDLEEEERLSRRQSRRNGKDERDSNRV